MDMNIRIAYLTAGEDLNSPLLRRQVIELLCEIKQQHPGMQITLFSFLTLHTILNHLGDLKQVRELLEPYEIKLKLIPSLVPWPFPHVKLRMTDVGYRPYHAWTELAAKLFCLVVWPVMAYYYLCRGVNIFHCRSYPPAYASVLFSSFFSKIKVIFDPRSDFPEENISAGNWELDDSNYIFWKKAEKLILDKSDAIACIAPSYESTYRTISPLSNYFIVPNNVDCTKFQRNKVIRTTIRNKLGIREDEFILCYLGGMTLGGWHRADIYTRACDVFIQAQVPCRFLFIVPQYSNDLLRSSLSIDVCNDFAIIVTIPYEDVPSYLSAADYGVMLLHKSKIAVGTKIGEYLSAGLPIITNKNCIGATDLIKNHDIGVLVNLGLGDLDPSLDLNSILLTKTMSELSDWSLAVSNFAKSYFDNSTIANEYYKQYRLFYKN